jgi:hypothetical protein
MIACWKCAEQIQDAAVACRFCNANQASLERTRMISDEISASNSKSRGAKKNLFALGGIIGLVWLANQCSTSPSDLQQSQQTSEVLPIISVSASELVKAYDENEVRAQQDYGNHILDVTGVVGSITLDITNDPSISFDVSGTLTGVSVDFAEGQSQFVAELKKGQTITVRCNEISELVARPVLRGCVL